MTIKNLRHTFCAVASVAAALLAAAPATEARVTKIVIDQKVSPAFPLKEGGFQSFGAAGQYETFAGNAHGELDPNDPRNAVIQDIQLAPKNANGKVDYVARFFVVKPIDMSKASGLLWHDVPNRGRRVVIPPVERNAGDAGLSSGGKAITPAIRRPVPTTIELRFPSRKIPTVRRSPARYWGASSIAAGRIHNR